MKVVVFGASRGIGIAVLRLLLESGHTATAVARDLSGLGERHPGLRLVRGDARLAATVRKAVAGQEAVVHAVGTGITWRRVTLFSESTRHVLEAMRGTGCSRLIAITGIGAGDSRGHGGFFYDRIIQPLLLRTIYADKDRQEALIRASEGIDWTIVRPGMLHHGPRTGLYRVLVDLTGVRGGWIARNNVADLVLKELKSPALLRQTVLQIE